MDNDNPLDIDQTLYQSLTFLPNSTFYWLMRGFHRTYATGVACWQGTLTPPDTRSCLIWDLFMFYLLRPILFSNLSLFFPTMNFEYPSVRSRFAYDRYVQRCINVRVFLSSLMTCPQLHNFAAICQDFMKMFDKEILHMILNNAVLKIQTQQARKFDAAFCFFSLPSI